jgi:hypothetical protein
MLTVIMLANLANIGEHRQAGCHGQFASGMMDVSPGVRYAPREVFPWMALRRRNRMEPVESRRSLLSGVTAAIAAIALGSKRAAAQAPGEAFQPARHQPDEWMTRVTGKHRTIIDCATVSGAGEGMLYANNLYVGNRTAIS